ncbi:MAG: hypothetical protein QOF78_227 [Phycisphaerales bacterium]|jgi:hypothetical protein|nr:hypothetical protein [Phycisphaerales bacterium]
MSEIPSPPPWQLSDEKLLAECRIDSYVGSGPGGQKRHKTNAAVRITHEPTRTVATATDSRSHRENHIHALRNLRHKLAMDLRREIPDLVNYQPPAWFADYPALRINPKNPKYPAVVAEALDVLKTMHWSIGKAAAMLGVTTTAFTRFLHDDPALWTKVNDARVELGMKALRWER